MEVELLNINGDIIPHAIVTIIGDGACLFRALSYLMYGTQLMAREVRELIVRRVVDNWEEFSIMTHDSVGNNYTDYTEYFNDMSRLFTYGGLCELVAAGQQFEFFFEVYRNSKLYESFGDQRHPVLRLRFTQNLSNGHFDAYLPQSEEVSTTLLLSQPNINSQFLQSTSFSFPKKTTGKRRVRYTNNKRKKQLKDAARNYARNNPGVNRAAVARYQQTHPEVHRTAVSKYQQYHPEVHRAAQSRYDLSNPGRREERRQIPWKVKAHSGMAYDPEVTYETDSTLSLGTMSNKCQYCNALMWKEETSGMCCSSGKVQLLPLEPPPEPLHSLLMNHHTEHAHFMDHIRKYNGCFQMTSFGSSQAGCRGRLYANFQSSRASISLGRKFAARVSTGSPVPANLFCGRGRKRSAFKMQQLS